VVASAVSEAAAALGQKRMALNDSDLRKGAIERATTTFAAIRAPRSYDRDHNLFGTRRWGLFGRDYEDLWPFTSAWSALCTLGSLPDQKDTLDLADAMLDGLRRYSEESQILEDRGEAGFESVVGPPLGSGGDRYYDDNAWLGLALVRHHELTGNPELLRLAQRVFSFLISGWSTETTWRFRGGIRWKESTGNRSRNACANAPTAELAARLHRQSGATIYLDWSVRIYQWTRGALRGADGLYVDRVAPDGSRTPTIWSYNQGSMIGAGVLLARETNDPSFLEHAAETAGAYVDSRDLAALLTQDPAFNAVLFRNLLVLDQVRPDDRYRSLAAQYSSAMWASKRLRHGFFAGNGSPLNNAAAMVQIDALLAGAQPHP
jgi:Glycosyl hydrolase family 76